MKNTERLILGLAATALVFAIATVGTRLYTSEIGFFPKSFVTHSIMLALSIVLILAFRKNLTFRVALPDLRTSGRAVLFALLATIGLNILLTFAIKLAGAGLEVHPALESSTPLQIFLFVFIYASLAEEVLVRGFLQNLLAPLQTRGFVVFRRRLSLPVITGALVFGLLHLILLTSGVSVIFVVRVVIFTTVLGLIAGYYQEKHNNFAYAVLVHMAGNLPGLLAAFMI
ncbi:MAG: CPBP family intramembrane glutamic endopeptidase [Bacteroidales bacterium]|jgi:membrane protease YdiL (CAAX protease family)|nr:CPBP family intramembrane glutamic endopeptidase [Bacteroidales bacterium]NLK79671.1 CPBP family intramembrane metalloprotease [Bacteroidales bacterium]HKM31384.1 CPBP family intramembrane glutamic endopeptidase [Bacteroidales bacterium]